MLFNIKNEMENHCKELFFMTLEERKKTEWKSKVSRIKFTKAFLKTF